MVEELIAYLPDVIKVILPLIIGIVAIILYTQVRKMGFIFVGIAFFLLSIPNIILIALGGPFLVERLMNQGLTVSEIALYQFYIFLMSAAFGIAFTIMVIVGLYLLRKD
jgi:hypothetical protein